jgi:hypothetical protein
MDKAFINIYDITGQLIRRYEVTGSNSQNGNLPKTSGKDVNYLSISSSDLGNGIYFYKLETKGQVLGSKKMVVIK